MRDSKNVSGFVYVNSDMAKHYPAHFSKVYTDLNLQQIGLSSKQSSLQFCSRLIRIEFWAGRHFKFRHLMFPFVFWFFITSHIRCGSRKYLVIVHDSPIALLLGVFLRFLKIVPSDTRIVYRICHLFGEDLLVRCKGLKRVFVLAWMKMRYLSLEYSDTNIFMSEAMKSYLSNNQNSITRKDLVIPSLVNVEELFSFRILKDKYRKSVRGVYIGNVDLNRDFEFFFGALNTVVRDINFYLDVFAVFNSETEMKRMLTLISDHQLEGRVVIKEPLRGTSFYQKLATYDFGLSIFAREGAHFYNSPVKTLEYTVLGIPWIGSDIPEHRRILADLGLHDLADKVLIQADDRLEDKYVKFLRDLHLIGTRNLPMEKLGCMDLSYSKRLIGTLMQ